MTNTHKPANDAYKARAASTIEKAFSCDQRGYRNSPMMDIVEGKMKAEMEAIVPSKAVLKLQAEYIKAYRKMKDISNALKQTGWEIDTYSDNFKLKIDSDGKKHEVWNKCLAQAKNDKRKLIEAVYAATTIAEVTDAVEKAESYK